MIVPTNPYSQSSRRRWLKLAAVFVLLSIVVVSWWWFVLKPGTDERRPFVGTWRLESPLLSKRPDLVSELDLEPDGTMRDRLVDHRTGEVLLDEPREGRWRLVDGRFQEVFNGDPVSRYLLGKSVTTGWNHTVTWLGPDCFQLEPPWPNWPTMVWVRHNPPAGR
jgi:hypothetical protein